MAAWETTLSSVQIVEKNVSHCLITVLHVSATPTQMTYDMTPTFKSFTMKGNNQFLINSFVTNNCPNKQSSPCTVY